MNNLVDAGEEDGGDVICNVSVSESGVFLVELRINNKKIKMQLDTGSSITVMSLADFKRYFTDVELCNSNLIMRTFLGRN